MHNATNEPLVWTTKGNLPVASLTYSTTWQDSPEATVFIEVYRQGDEVVKQSVHVMSKQGLASEAIAGNVN